MMQHTRSRTGWRGRFITQLLVWTVVMGAVLFLVTGCKSDVPAPGESGRPGPTFVRDSLPTPACGRCFERPELGHAS